MLGLMSSNLYIAATEPMSGKSVVALGVMELLSRRQARLGFFRPVVARADAPDLGGELFVPKIPSYRITDVAEAIGPSCAKPRARPPPSRGPRRPPRPT